MKRNNTCPFCNINPAPFAPNRLERNGQAAHEGCVRAKTYPGVLEAADRFILDHGGEERLAGFKESARRVNSPKSLAKVLSTVLRAMLANATNGRSAIRRQIVAFAEQASDRLFCEVSVAMDDGAPQPRKAAAKGAAAAG